MEHRGEDIVWNLRGRHTVLRPPLIMGILNVTPDSFVPSSRTGNAAELLERAGGMLQAGAHLLDVGGASTRPGAPEVAEAEERERVIPAIEALVEAYPQALISVDTWRAGIASRAVEAGACMVNDIGAGRLDPAMLATVAGLKVPYVMMHMQGTPKTMQHAPHYEDVVAEVTHFLSERVEAARRAGIADVVIDPGFGFGKDKGHNYALLAGLRTLKATGAHLLVGLSRKRMINEVLGTTPEEALNGTTVANTLALLNGADILRVHDVLQAVQAVKVVGAWREAVARPAP